MSFLSSLSRPLDLLTTKKERKKEEEKEREKERERERKRETATDVTTTVCQKCDCKEFES